LKNPALLAPCERRPARPVTRAAICVKQDAGSERDENEAQTQALDDIEHLEAALQGCADGWVCVIWRAIR
jgi:hypothetical protein